MSPLAKKLLAALTLLGVCASAQATLYKWVDAQGVVHYSDTPQPGAQAVNLPPIQTFHTPTVTPPASSAPSDASAPQVYQSCEISSPSADQAFYAPDSVPIAVSLNPTLRQGDRLTVSVDGAALPADSASSTAFVVRQPDRGQHTVTAVVRDGDGKMVCSASAVTFSVQRPSVLFPNSPARH